jgi:hypothetical protein
MQFAPGQGDDIMRVMNANDERINRKKRVTFDTERQETVGIIDDNDF